MNQFFEELLGLDESWKVTGVEKDDNNRRITVQVAYAGDKYRCPGCGLAAVIHDNQKRTVRHLDTCEYQTWLEVRYPRVVCARHGTQAVVPPFAAASSRFTKAFESRVIELCIKTPVQKVANDMGLHWHVVAGIIDRSFKRGRAKQVRQAKKEKIKVHRMGMDEKGWRGHDCVTVITDTDRGIVLDVLNGRDAEIVRGWFETQQLFDFSELKSVSMDMARPYIKAVRDFFPNAEEMICFDRFHVARLFATAVDAVRRRESAAFDRRRGENPLTKTRFDWLRNSIRTDNRMERRRKFIPLTATAMDTAKAWRLKERASMLWNYAHAGTAEKAWKQLLWRLSHSRVAEMKNLFKTIKRHLQGILNAIKLRANNAAAEARNSCIQRLRYAACGYRNRERFRRDILFQFGGLDLSF